MDNEGKPLPQEAEVKWENGNEINVSNGHESVKTLCEWRDWTIRVNEEYWFLIKRRAK